jgi:predicted  nucleic acid-binding Zn-ribbon protein
MTNAATDDGSCAGGAVQYVAFTGKDAQAIFASNTGRYHYDAEHMPRVACKLPSRGNSANNILRRRNAAMVVNVRGRTRPASEAIATFRDDIITKARYIETLLAARALPEAARAALMDIAELIGPFFAFMDRVCQVNKSLCSNRTFLLSFAPKLHADFVRRYEAVLAHRSRTMEVLFAFGGAIRLSIRAFGAGARAALLLNSRCYNLPLTIMAGLIAVWSGGMVSGGALAVAQPLSSVAYVMQTLANEYPAVLMMLLLGMSSNVPELMTWFRKELVSHMTARSGKALAAQVVVGGAGYVFGGGAPGLAIATNAIKMIDKMDTTAADMASTMAVNSSLSGFLNAAEGMWASSSPEARAAAIATGSLSALALGKNVPGYDWARSSASTLFAAGGGGTINMIRSVSAELNMPMTGTALEAAAHAAGVRNTAGQYAGGVASRAATKLVGSGWTTWTADSLKSLAKKSASAWDLNTADDVFRRVNENAAKPPPPLTGLEQKKAEVKAMIMGLYEEQPAAFACMCAILAAVAGIAWATNVGDLATPLAQNYRTRIDDAAAVAGAHGARISEALQQKAGIAERAIAALEAEIVRVAGAEKPVERGRLNAAAKALGANVQGALEAREERLNSAMETLQTLAKEPDGLFGEKGRATLVRGAQSIGRQIAQDEVLSKVNHIKTMWSSVQSQVDELKARIQAAKKAASADVHAIEKIEANMSAELDGDGPAVATPPRQKLSPAKHTSTPTRKLTPVQRRRAPAMKKPAAARSRRVKTSPNP